MNNVHIWFNFFEVRFHVELSTAKEVNKNPPTTAKANYTLNTQLDCC